MNRYHGRMHGIRRSQLKLFCAAACSLLWNHANGQVILNEIFENPPGRGVEEIGWEYLELYGRPGQSLDGCVVLLLKGGMDADRDGVPEVLPEIDEVFSLDGVRLSSTGFFTLVGNRADGESPIADRFFTSNPDFDPRRKESSSNLRWLDALSFQAAIKTSAAAGDEPSRVSRLDNHGSSTYVLARVRPEDRHLIPMLRGVCHDANFDGQIDPYVEIDTVMTPFPVLQMLDEVAWSHRAGKEYMLLRENKLSETHGLNPDALSRVSYFVNPPNLGWYTRDRINSDGAIVGFEVRPTTKADESFVYGVMDSTRFPGNLAYFDGYDLDGWPQLRGPTDQQALPYEIGDTDPEPDHSPFPTIVPRRPGASILLDDAELGGFVLTPGYFNDHPAKHFRQFRLVPGDLNMDGVVDEKDLSIAQALLGASISEMVEDPESPAGERYLWHGPVFQQLMHWLEPDTLDGDRVAGPADLVRLRSLIEESDAD